MAIQHEQMRTWLLPEFGDVRLDRITQSAVKGWVGGMRGKVSPLRVRQAYRLLHQVLQHAVHPDHVFTVNPAEGVTVRIGRTPEMAYLTAEEVERLVYAMPAPWDLVVLLQAYCGLRIGEVMALQRRWWLPSENRLVVAASVGEAGGRQTELQLPKNGYQRHAEPPPSVAARLDEHLDTVVGPSPDAFLFAAATATP